MKKVIVIILSVMIVCVSGCGEKLEEKQVTTKIITEEMPESTITEEISSTTELVNKAELKPVKKDNKIETGGTLENKNVETEMPRQDQDTNRDSQITDDQPEIAADQLENTTSEKESSETTEITEEPNTTERVNDMRRATSLKAGGVGMRYTCMIDDRERHLYYEDNNLWFVEGRA